MEKLKLRYVTLIKATETFKKSIDLYHQIKKERVIQCGPFFYDDLVLSMRDSLIQRFEYSVDLLWKYLKLYLENVQKVHLELSSPKYIIRTCTKIGFLTENEGEKAIEMIEHRNLTSHIYREEIAEMLAQEAPEYYEFIKNIADKAQPE